MTTSLTRVAITTRKIVRYGIFLIVALIVGRIALTVGTGIYKKVHPAPPPKVTVAYGKLTKIPFPTKTVPANLSFTLETADGTYPKFVTQAKVFFLPKPASNLLSLATAKSKAESLGFDPNGQQISPTVYRFTNKTAPATLTMEIITDVFSLSYDLKTDPTPLDSRPPFPEIAAANVRSFLSSADLLPADLTGVVNHEFLKIQDDAFVTALSQSEAKVIKINLTRKNYGDLPCVTADPSNANEWFLVSGSGDRARQIVAAEFHYFPADETQFSTYPIKTAEEAWKEFAGGGGYVANPGDNKDGDAIKIRKMYLAYYDPGVQTDFMQPVVVLEGDKGFSAYVPAVTTDYYGR